MCCTKQRTRRFYIMLNLDCTMRISRIEDRPVFVVRMMLVSALFFSTLSCTLTILNDEWNRASKSQLELGLWSYLLQVRVIKDWANSTSHDTSPRTTLEKRYPCWPIVVWHAWSQEYFIYKSRSVEFFDIDCINYSVLLTGIRNFLHIFSSTGVVKLRIRRRSWVLSQTCRRDSLLLKSRPISLIHLPRNSISLF